MKRIQLKEGRLLSSEEMKSLLGGSGSLWECRSGECAGTLSGKLTTGSCNLTVSSSGIPNCYCAASDASGNLIPLSGAFSPCWVYKGESGSGESAP